MSDRNVAAHYTVTGLGEQILAALKTAGKDPDALTVEDLAPVDSFHIRGRVATEELAGLANIGSGDRLLDVGCGLGGTSRYLASATGCRVVGLDLTDEYCRVAEMLSQRVGLGDRTVFHQGSALSLPFEGGGFDVAWTEHVQMNIRDKAAFYGEMARALKPGGRLVFHDVFAGEAAGDLRFPVPWAADDSISHLISVPELRNLLQGLGFVETQWEDKSDASLRFFEAVLQRVQTDGWMPLGLHLLMGEDAGIKFDNVRRNLEDRRIRVVQAVMTRQA